MKAIMMSIKPQHVANILNGLKTLEIRKHFPKDYVGWVYIYCTKDSKQGFLYKHLVPKKFNDDSKIGNIVDCEWKTEILKDTSCLWEEEPQQLNGKVVARFWCNGVEEIYNKLIREITNDYSSSGLPISTVAQMSCLTKEKLLNYVGDNGGYAIHIDKLDIFDKSKELKEFYKVGCEEYFTKHVFVNHPDFRPRYESELKQFQLTHAPESYCYIEV